MQTHLQITTNTNKLQKTETNFHVKIFYFIRYNVQVTVAWNITTNRATNATKTTPTQHNTTVNTVREQQYQIVHNVSCAVKDKEQTILFKFTNTSNQLSSASWTSANICMTLTSLYANEWQSQSHSQIRTRCTSVCGWRSCRASSSESENLCSSSYWQVQKELGWAQTGIKLAASAGDGGGRWTSVVQPKNPHAFKDQKNKQPRFLYVVFGHEGRQVPLTGRYRKSWSKNDRCKTTSRCKTVKQHKS